jgi:hypothetical protein
MTLRPEARSLTNWLAGIPGLRSSAKRSHCLRPFAPLPQKRRRPAARGPLSGEARPAGLEGQYQPVGVLVHNVGRARSVPVEGNADTCELRDSREPLARLKLA